MLCVQYQFAAKDVCASTYLSVVAGKLFMAHTQVPAFRPVPSLFPVGYTMQLSNHEGVSVVNDKARTVNSMA